jgi:hypothetical protein
MRWAEEKPLHGALSVALMRTRSRAAGASPASLRRAVSEPEKRPPGDAGTHQASAPPSLGAAFGVLLTSAAVSRGVPFLVNVAVAHKLTPHEFGIPTVHFALVRRHF